MYAREAKVVIATDGKGTIGIFSLGGDHLVEIRKENDSSEVSGTQVGKETLNHVHSSYLDRFLTEGEGFEEI